MSIRLVEVLKCHRTYYYLMTVYWYVCVCIIQVPVSVCAYLCVLTRLGKGHQYAIKFASAHRLAEVLMYHMYISTHAHTFAALSYIT